MTSRTFCGTCRASAPTNWPIAHGYLCRALRPLLRALHRLAGWGAESYERPSAWGHVTDAAAPPGGPQ